jgi:hypothetical protein
MKIYSVFDKEFRPYGKIVEGYNTAELLNKLVEVSEKPHDRTLYVASDSKLESLPIAKSLSANLFGGQDIQIGYCNGSNTVLNALEYHRDSEVNISPDDFILLLALREDIIEGKLDSSVVKAFKAPAGVMVEVFATALHYAPCNAKAGEGFRVVVILPRGTNGAAPEITPLNCEDKMLRARNKWLLAHPDSPDAVNGAYVGITGENIDIAAII